MRRAARRIVEKLRLHGHEAFFAGGWVRDVLLRRKPKDVDIATSALPEEVLSLFPNSRSIGAQFGVIQVSMYGHAYEVATFRKESTYLDGRHPSSVVFCGPEQDAHRRDFTINGLFYDPIADRLIDYVHGRNDIQNKLIRTIGDPRNRFEEDKLRMLRAVRLSCSLSFKIVPETWNAIEKLAPGILQVSWERIRDELINIFTGPAPDAGLSLLYESGLLKHILPEIAEMRRIPRSSESVRDMDVLAHTGIALAMLRKPSPSLAFGTLLHDVGKPSTYSQDEHARFKGHEKIGGKISEEVCRRLRMSNEEVEQIADLVRTHMDFIRVSELPKSALSRLLRKPNISDHLELFRVNCLSGGKSLKIYSDYTEKLQEYKKEPAKPPLIKGEDLIELGYSPGPVFSEILRAVEDLQLEGILRSREDAIRHVKAAFPIANKPQP
jgi:poly(A) polymerase